VWSLLSDEAGWVGTLGESSPLVAVVMAEVRWARWLLGEVEVGGGISGESSVGDLLSLHVLVWVVNPCWIDDKWRWSWMVLDLDGRDA